MLSRMLPSGRMSYRVHDFSPAQVGVMLAVVLLLTSMPVWTHRLPPLSDYINHLARMFVIARGAEDANISRFYTVEWQIIPNLMMDLVVPPLGRVMNIYLAGQVFTIAMFALMLSGTLALHRSLFGRWSVVGLVAAPLLFNHIFLLGYMNYLFGVGLASWGLAAWIMMQRRPVALRLAVSALIVVGLFFCHLFAVGLYGMGLLAFEGERLWRQRGRPWKELALQFMLPGIAFLPVIPLMLASPTKDLAGDMEWEPRGKIDGLRYVIETYSDIAAFALTAAVIGGAIWAFRHHLLRVHRVGLALLVIGTVVYLAMPRMLFASYTADQRLPVALAFMLVGMVDVRLHHRLVRRSFIALLLVLLAVRLIEVDVSWSDLSATTTEFRASTKRLKPGSKVLVAYATPAGGDDVADLGLVHAVCIAMIERQSLVTTAFTTQGKQILRVRPEYRELVDREDGTPPTVAQLVVEAERPDPDAKDYWRDWSNRFDYLYVLFTGDETPNPDPARLTLLQDGDRFQLYRINRP